jgi:hypothetical protein
LAKAQGHVPQHLVGCMHRVWEIACVVGMPIADLALAFSVLACASNAHPCCDPLPLHCYGPLQVLCRRVHGGQERR